jgi:hypothetical protein
MDSRPAPRIIPLRLIAISNRELQREEDASFNVLIGDCKKYLTLLVH